jgi:hypothetical protein
MLSEISSQKCVAYHWCGCTELLFNDVETLVLHVMRIIELSSVHSNRVELSRSELGDFTFGQMIEINQSSNNDWLLRLLRRDIYV